MESYSADFFEALESNTGLKLNKVLEFDGKVVVYQGIGKVFFGIAEHGVYGFEMDREDLQKILAQI